MLFIVANLFIFLWVMILESASHFSFKVATGKKLILFLGEVKRVGIMYFSDPLSFVLNLILLFI